MRVSIFVNAADHRRLRQASGKREMSLSRYARDVVLVAISEDLSPPHVESDPHARRRVEAHADRR